MEAGLKERCIYCGGDVYYHGSEKLIKCDWCGNTLVVAKFENELARIRETEKENSLIKKQLKEAEQEKQAADNRLFDALSSLSEIRDDQDSLGKMLHLLNSGQGEALQQLQFIKGIAQQLVSSQDDVFAQMAVVNEIRQQLEKLGIDDRKHQSVLREFVLWSQQIHEDDIKRLQNIGATTDSLLAGQREIRDKVDELKKTADRHQETLNAFQGEYQKDRLEDTKAKLKKLQSLYHRAEGAQHDRAFDRAEEFYQQVLTEGGADPEVYWRLLMCHYGLTYQKNDEGELIPIILNPDLTDPADMSLRKDLEQSMTQQESPHYRTELAKIDAILDSYRQVKHDWKFDVFISVKQKKDGHYTDDREIGLDLCDYLNQRGLRVFNSERTKPPVGELYEPYIISALLSAKALIVVGTCKENMESQWVKNEWSRFQWLQFHEKKLTGRTDRKLLCYLAKGMQPREIPKALNPDRQAIIDGITAHEALLSALRDILPSDKKPNMSADDTGSTPAVPTADAPKESPEQVLEQMTVLLTLGEYDQVLRKHESLKITAPYMSEPRFHLYALCAKNQIDEIEQLADLKSDLGKERLFKLALKLSKDPELTGTLKKLLEKNQQQNRASNTSQEEKKTVSRPEPRKPEPAVQAAPVTKTEPVKPTVPVTKTEPVKKVDPVSKPPAAKPEEKPASKSASEPDRRQISDSWEEIIRNIRNHTYKQKYRLGEVKELDLGDEGTIPMILAAFDTDELADGSGKAPMTWIAGKGLKTKRRMCPPDNPKDPYALIFAQNWETCELRSYLRKSLKAKLPDCVSAHICEVKKQQLNNSPSKDTTTDTLWLPSAREIGLPDKFEKEGSTCYTAVFRDAASRRREIVGEKSSSTWWLRSAGGLGSNFYSVNGSGEHYATKGFALHAVVFGFCLGSGNAVDDESSSKKILREKGHAALNSFSEAEEFYQLGEKAYKEGNYTEAVKQYQKAAENGDAHAQYELGSFYENGVGVSKNREEARRWYQMAAQQGHSKAKEGLERLSKKRKWFF